MDYQVELNKRIINNKEVRILLEIYDITGQKIETLIDRRLISGMYHTIWNATGKSSGIYFYRLKVDNFNQVNKIVLVK